MKSFVTRKMFRVAAVLVCGAGLVVSAAMAQQDTQPAPPDGQQQGPPPGGRRMMDPARRAEMLQRRLGLTGDQTTQVLAIFTADQAKMETLRANTSLTEQDRRAQAQGLHLDEETKVRALLTPDQQTKYDEMEATRRERRGDGQGGNAPPPQPQQPQQ